MANSEADERVDPVHISAAGNRAVARHHDTIEVQGARQAEFQGQVLVPVSGPRQQIDGGTANAAGVPSGNLVSGAKLDDGFRKVDIGVSTDGQPANGSGDAAV